MAPTDFDAARGGHDPARAPGDELDVPLEDPEQMEEVELLSSLMIQAGTSEEPLDQAEVDRLLGIEEDSAGRS
jgi:hypothetical protein